MAGRMWRGIWAVGKGVVKVGNNERIAVATSKRISRTEKGHPRRNASRQTNPIIRHVRMERRLNTDFYWRAQPATA